MTPIAADERYIHMFPSPTIWFATPAAAFAIACFALPLFLRNHATPAVCGAALLVRRHAFFRTCYSYTPLAAATHARHIRVLFARFTSFDTPPALRAVAFTYPRRRVVTGSSRRRMRLRSADYRYLLVYLLRRRPHTLRATYVAFKDYAMPTVSRRGLPAEANGYNMII